jgi:TusA-related sulfurtransferase
MSPELIIDVVGRACPVPVIELARHIGDVRLGAVIRVRSDDPAARYDIPAWCSLKGHDYLGGSAEQHITTYRVRRGMGTEQSTLD